MPDVDASLVEEVLDVAQLQLEPHVQHHGQADDLGRGLEVAEGRSFGHVRKGRLATVSAASSIPLTEPILVMWILVLGTGVTIVRRVARIVNNLNRR